MEQRPHLWLALRGAHGLPRSRARRTQRACAAHRRVSLPRHARRLRAEARRRRGKNAPGRVGRGRLRDVHGELPQQSQGREEPRARDEIQLPPEARRAPGAGGWPRRKSRRPLHRRLGTYGRRRRSRRVQRPHRRHARSPRGHLPLPHHDDVPLRVPRMAWDAR